MQVTVKEIYESSHLSIIATDRPPILLRFKATMVISAESPNPQALAVRGGGFFLGITTVPYRFIHSGIISLDA